MKTLGICFGTSTLQAVGVIKTGSNTEIFYTRRIIHQGNPANAFIELLDSVADIPFDRITVTGRAFRKSVGLTSITEPNAVEQALKTVYRAGDFPDIVISLGGETMLIYRLSGNGNICSVLSGNKCASGSGEFFLQQISRIGLTLDEAVALALKGSPCKIAGRCSVFCKSDCTHALNKGELRENIVAGLCMMMADKICGMIKDNKCRSAAIIGGGAFNAALVNILKGRFDRLDLPEPVGCFEAYGAALWAAAHNCIDLPKDRKRLITVKPRSFGTHKPLLTAKDLVEFRPSICGIARENDRCILGLDVGSTTTKAVLMRMSDSAIVASVYLRTDGDPVNAARKCYRSIKEKINVSGLNIMALGVTGSGRQLAALHAFTECIVNEIIAHATAAAHFDKSVDTIFEIGGQDAKYTYLTNGIPSDYAMNEACSAGTGSFLEEAAWESLHIKTEEIGDAAMQAQAPPNFTDQCAAFIGSDIKLASQEGIKRNDILAGLVYSICLNYLNRVKGNRTIGKRIFMQGGVCYNKAVPLAMASLLNRRIIVPPDPGLMGAFGVALEAAKQIAEGSLKEKQFDLDQLIERTAIKESSFICNGGAEKCDRKCSIGMFRMEGKNYPFGGACNRYYNLRIHREVNSSELDLVALRQKILFNEFGTPYTSSGKEKRTVGRTVGIMRSFLTYTLYPLYSNFFTKLGFSIVMPDKIDQAGISMCEAEFCFPAQISHGSMKALLELEPDFIFLPQIMQIPVPNVPTYSRTCVFVQGEPYYLSTTFREEIQKHKTTVLKPVIRMDSSYEAGLSSIITMASEMGIGQKEAEEAFIFACTRQKEFEKRLIEIGNSALDRLEQSSEKIGIVLFGRPYNAFAGDANMGIPHKFASRDVMVIPFDMLAAAGYRVNEKMFWAMGQKIMKAAQLVKEKPNLFGCFITNFSCGPDSFLLGYFRREMGEKPSLTLELDQHTADAGIDTRIEAALSIMASFKRSPKIFTTETLFFRPAKVVYDKEIHIITSHGRKLPLRHKDVEVVLPSMGRYSTEGLAAVMRWAGINARALPVSDNEVLREGRSCTSCKECLPYILTTGSFMKYLKTRNDTWKATLLFLPTGGGPCRLGQYCVALEHLIEGERIENAAVFTITDENGYGGLGGRALLRAWQAITIADVFGDIRSILSVAAVNRDEALRTLEELWSELLNWFEGRLSIRLSTLLTFVAMRLKKIPLKTPPEELPVVSLVGEIFVRRDEFSRNNLIDYLEKEGFAVRVAPAGEYLCYSNFVVNSGLGERQFNLNEKVRMQLIAKLQEWWERRIKSLLSKSGVYRFETIEVETTIKGVRHLLNENFRGETILTVGLAMREILNDSCGVISIGPFGCMPSRMAEAMLKKEMTPQGKSRMEGWEKRAMLYSDGGVFPFLSIETDGSPFPQLVEANLEAFVLQAYRLHKRMTELRTDRTTKRIWRSLPVTLYDLFLGGRKEGGKIKKVSAPTFSDGK